MQNKKYKKIEIYTDGSCNVSKKVGGWSAVTKEWIIMGHKYDTTNNEMELYAILQGIKNSQKYSYDEVHIYTDSDYAYKTFTKWVYNWESNGWKKKGGRIRNLELIKEIFIIVKDNPLYVFHKVKAHDGITLNEMADKLAKNSYYGLI